MRKIIITTASILVLMTVGVGFTINANADKAQETELQHSTTVQEEDVQELDVQELETDSQEEYPEYTEISNVIHMDDLQADVVEDNKRKRVIIFKDDNDQPQYKSIYVKKKERLKVIDFNGGLLFNDVISKSEEASEEEVNHDVVEEEAGSNELSEFKETTILEDHVDVSQYNVQVKQDNPHKRVILLQDDKHRPQYKSIYVKDKNYLKIIDLNGGLLYKGTI